MTKLPYSIQPERRAQSAIACLNSGQVPLCHRATGDRTKERFSFSVSHSAFPTCRTTFGLVVWTSDGARWLGKVRVVWCCLILCGLTLIEHSRTLFSRFTEPKGPVPLIYCVTCIYGADSGIPYPLVLPSPRSPHSGVRDFIAFVLFGHCVHLLNPESRIPVLTPPILTILQHSQYLSTGTRPVLVQSTSRIPGTGPGSLFVTPPLTLRLDPPLLSLRLVPTSSCWSSLPE